MKVEITDEGIIYCDGITCNPLSLFYTNAECGSCPVMRICEEYWHLLVEGAGC